MTVGLVLGPRSFERPADAGHTLVGTLDDARPSLVDGGGLVQPAGVSWSIDWHVRAEDRWYFPARETTVRQRRIGAGSVLETSVRIPSGDAIQRVYAVSTASGSMTVIEVENDSPVPVALAVSIRPYGVAADSMTGHRASETTGQISITDERVVVDGRPALLLPRPAHQLEVASDGDLLARLESDVPLGGLASSNGGSPSATVIYPLPHRTSLQFVVPGPDSTTHPGPLPGHEAVANGWTSVIDAGGRFSFPDSGVTQLAAAARARILGEADTLPPRVAALEPGSGRLLEALALSGAVGEILGSLGAVAGTFATSLPGTPGDAAAIVSGVGRAARLADDVAVAEALLEPVAQLTYLVEKSKDRLAGNEAVLGLMRLLVAAGQPEPAHALLPRVVDAKRMVDVPSDLDELSALAEQANPAGSWGADDPVQAARFWLGARRMLIGGDPRHLQLLPVFPTAWLGGEVEVHDAATTHGLVSFAIRWHGYRPALLWELKTETPTEIRCPGLDPEWSTMERSGEALLAGSADALPEPPAAGESFS